MQNISILLFKKEAIPEFKDIDIRQLDYFTGIIYIDGQGPITEITPYTVMDFARLKLDKSIFYSKDFCISICGGDIRLTYRDITVVNGEKGKRTEYSRFNDSIEEYIVYSKKLNWRFNKELKKLKISLEEEDIYADSVWEMLQ